MPYSDMFSNTDIISGVSRSAPHKAFFHSYHSLSLDPIWSEGEAVHLGVLVCRSEGENGANEWGEEHISFALLLKLSIT